ncbi:hypothetical protein CVT25_002882 [Psilocybe cyanescens]|uniref:Uncharacterized protein n=1 Tax=Psilocybe cyanescens TaxID=93625 RepID=A0A409WKZ1_PSICY|nr:hypothetical protein CVT25_002882 [Psilocybe cyanescens]
MSARAAPSPRLLQPYSPRRPSPLGLPPLGFPPAPPLAPHIAFQGPSYPLTPERHIQPKGPSESRVPYPPEARRPLAGTQSQSRPRSQPVLPPLNLNSEHHPPTQAPQPKYPGTAQPAAKQEMTMVVSPPSPTPSDTSSLSLYSAESITKTFPVEVAQQMQKMQQEEDERPPSLFCGCINFKGWFGSSKKAKERKILGPPVPPVPQPAPQTVQFDKAYPPTKDYAFEAPENTSDELFSDTVKRQGDVSIPKPKLESS